MINRIRVTKTKVLLLDFHKLFPFSSLIRAVCPVKLTILLPHWKGIFTVVYQSCGTWDLSFHGVWVFVDILHWLDSHFLPFFIFSICYSSASVTIQKCLRNFRQLCFLIKLKFRPFCLFFGVPCICRWKGQLIRPCLFLFVFILLTFLSFLEISNLINI